MHIFAPMKRNFKGKKRTHTEFVVKANCTAEEFFAKEMSGKSRTALKLLLAKGAVTIEGKPVKRLDAQLTAGTKVVVGKKPDPQFKMPSGLRIVYEDKWLIVVNKDSGLLTMATDKVVSKTAYAYISNYLKFYDERAKVFIVHRLDRDTSGLLIFAKSEEVKEMLQENWNETVSDRRYVAVLEGYPQEDEGRVHTWLHEHPKSLKVSVCPEGEGVEAITNYRVMAKNRGYALVELELETGRKNQIRVHMKHIGHPVAGDVKYGAQTNPIDRLCLHAVRIDFVHPMTGKNMSFTTKLPFGFNNMFADMLPAEYSDKAKKQASANGAADTK